MANLGQRALFPIAADKHIIPPVSIKTQIEKKQNTRRDPFLIHFLTRFLPKLRPKLLNLKRNITIKPFPEPKPTDFSGAVGDFKINVAIDQKEVEVNDGIILR